MAARLFLNVFFSAWLAIRCLKIGTYVLIKVLLTYLSPTVKNFDSYGRLSSSAPGKPLQTKISWKFLKLRINNDNLFLVKNKLVL